MSTTRLRQILPISIITIFSLIIRIWHLNLPKGYIFDEIYYAKNANSLIEHGVELNEQGEADFIVHPPLGKWLIGIGIKIFGNNEFGWRIIPALVGTACVILIYLIAQRLFNSIFLSSTAALLMALDGLALVMSRVALLDIFLMFFILLCCYFILTNNLWLSGVAIGLAGASKWSGFFLIPLIIALTINWKNLQLSSLLRRLVQFIFIPIGVYFITWSGWILNSNGWGRQSGGNLFTSLWKYHIEILNFHRDLSEKHAYNANPWSWLVLGRPTSFYYESPSDCGAASCAQEILAIGTPVLWWAGVFAIAVTAGLFIVSKDRIAAFILAGIAGTYLPWFLIQGRTMFYFYAISILPFLILALIYTFNWALKYKDYRKYIGVFIIVVAINFIYFLPIFLGIQMPYSDWLDRMWLPSWI